MTNNELYTLIYSKYGIVTRARGCFLYTKKGVRLTDLYLENGRAILGWDTKNAGTFLKNQLNKGLTGGFICEDQKHLRLKKSVEQLLESARGVAFYPDKSVALKAALTISPESTAVYRPWNPGNSNWAETDCVIINPPLSWGDSICILAVKEPLIKEDCPLQDALTVPFALETAVTRAIYNLVAALDERTEKDWFVYDPVLTKYWERKGPYLFPKISENEYDDFVRHCLDSGLIINPNYNEPSVVPYGADTGVFSQLKKAPFKGDR